MAHSLYNEVTAVTGIGYPTNRVLGKLKSASLNLPYSLEDIKISHNDFAVTEVYNDSIRKLYRNYLYLIANAELVTTSSPVSSAPNYISVDPNFIATFSSTSTNPASGNSLSSMYAGVETHIAKKLDSNHFVYFTYSNDDSVVIESTTEFGTIKSVLSGNFVEFNPDNRETFKFKNVVSVDIVDEFLFVLDRGNLTLFKFDISGLLTNDPAIRRTGADDFVNPGRILLKTLGGTHYTQVKNRLIDPVSVSVYDKRIYILDNGTRSIKIYDLNFNYITDILHSSMYNDVQDDLPVSFVIDQLSNTNKAARGYILTSKGRIFEYNPTTNSFRSPVSLFETYLPYEIYVFDESRTPPSRDEKRLYKPEGSNFKKIVNCKSSKDILYVATNRNIYKLYKTSLETPITVLDFNTSTISHGNTWNVPINITTDFRDISSQTIASFDTVLHNEYDYIAVTTTTLSSITEGVEVSGYKTSTYLFKDKNITTKLYNDSFYTNYFTLSDIFVLPQEIVNSITFNKTTKKLIYNHYSLFENLNKKIYTYFIKANLGTSVVPAICTVNGYGFDKLSAFDDNDEFYIGVNEPLLTDVVNRPIELLYKQQEALFDFIKEDQLNTDPPSAVSTRLPGDNELAMSVVSLATNSVTVTGGETVQITVLRQNFASVDNHQSSIFYYTVLDGTIANNPIGKTGLEYIDITDPSVAVFKKGETELILEIDTQKFFARKSDGTLVKESEYVPGDDDRTFTLKIANGANCIIDDDDNINSTIQCIVTIKPSFQLYDIKLFGVEFFTNPTTTGEKFTARVGVQRESPDQNYSLSAACNIETAAANWPTDITWLPVVPARNKYSIYSPDPINPELQSVAEDFPPVFEGTVVGQVSAKHIDKTSTIFFTRGVSSIVFDLIAEKPAGYNSDIKADTHIAINIHNPTINAIINEEQTDTNIAGLKTVTLNEQYKPINLFLSGADATGTAISANYRVDESTTNNLLSCVNLWDFLYPSRDYTIADISNTNTNAFSTVSANYAVSASFTLQDSVSIISTDDTLPALYFKPPDGVTFEYFNNQIDIVVNSTNAVVGKGSRGGHGLALDDADEIDEVGTNFAGGDKFVQIGGFSENIEELITHTGVSGGPALSGFDTHFKQKILITNNGNVYGGAGGGGGGVVAVSASTMPLEAQALWFGCGGGGGGGIHAKNVGAAGLAAVDQFDRQVLLSKRNNAYIQDGSVSTSYSNGAGGAGGTWDISLAGYPSITLQPQLAIGADGNDTNVVISSITDSVTNFPGVTGMDGGNIGQAGNSDSASATVHFYPVDGVDTYTYGEVLAGYKMRVGGEAGNIIMPLQWTTINSTVKAPVTAGTGVFYGTGIFDPA